MKFSLHLFRDISRRFKDSGEDAGKTFDSVISFDLFRQWDCGTNLCSAIKGIKAINACSVTSAISAISAIKAIESRPTSITKRRGGIDMSQANDAWQILSREQLSTFVRRFPSVVFATVSGAHLYGFASADSDVDLRGVFLLPIEDLAGLSNPRETIAAMETADGVEVDFVIHDLRKFARMMLQHNGYVLEQLYSPLVVTGGDVFGELQKIGRGCITRQLFRHYRGFAHGRRQLLSKPGATVKHLLYAYRVYMTGIRVLRGGGIESNINVLNEEFRFRRIEELVARKREGAERQALQGDETAEHNRDLDKMESLLESASMESRLPDEPTVREELNDFIVRTRLHAIADGSIT